MNLFRGFGFFRDFAFLFYVVFFLEDSATDDRDRLSFRSGFFVLGLHEIGGQCGNLIVV